MQNRAVVSARDQARKAEVSAKSVPRPLRDDAKPAREVIPSSWQTTGPRAVPLPVSPCERDIFPLHCCPTPARVKGCRRTQHTNGRRRLTTELANDTVTSGNKIGSFTLCMHVESTDKKAFCPLAPSL